MITLKIPTKINEVESHILVRKARKTLGILSNPPQVRDGKLNVPKYFLCARDWDPTAMAEWFDGRPESGRLYTTKENIPRTMIEVSYDDAKAIYELFPDRCVWSDGPPHPNDLQLAGRVSTSGPVSEPEEP